MNILTLNYEFPPLGGGAAPVCYDICRHLVQKGHHVDVITMRYKHLPVFETKEGVNIYRTWALRRKQNICTTHEMLSFLPGAWATAMKRIKQTHYDIIHSHFIIPTGILALAIHKRTNIPYVLTAHGSDVPGYNPDRFNYQHLFTGPLLRAVCRNAKIITSPSIYLKELIQNNIGSYPIEHIPNGIDANLFENDKKNQKANIILATGRLLERKGFHTLIQAVHDEPLPFDVHIVGDGPYRSRLERLAEGSKTTIVFYGWLEPYSPALLELYQKAAIFTLLSSHENASIALLEAMAAKCAVITTNAAGCAETVGDAGFLIEFDNTNALLCILRRLTENNNLVKQYAEKAYHRLNHNFLWPRIIDQYLELYTHRNKTQDA